MIIMLDLRLKHSWEGGRERERRKKEQQERKERGNDGEEGRGRARGKETKWKGAEGGIFGWSEINLK